MLETELPFRIFFIPVLLENFLLRLRLDMWFQQGKCSPHISRIARAVINNINNINNVSEQVDRQIRPINYPSRLSDLIVRDYYLW